jgi:hypothetical protein
MQEVVDTVAKAQPFASIDVHNNTGENPHYGCINQLDNRFLQLSALFSRTVVFFETPIGVQSMAMAEYCPSVTIECGKPHLSYGVEHATDYLETVLHLDEISGQALTANCVDIYHTVARVTVPEACRFEFAGREEAHADNHDICFEPNFDKLNFVELTAGTVFGKVKFASAVHLQAWNDNNEDVSDEYFSVDNTNLLLNKAVMPAMITLDKNIIRQDCLCYLMERIML